MSINSEVRILGYRWLGLVGAMMVTGPIPGAAQIPEAVPFLRVNGTAQVSVPADGARISFVVETQSKTAQMAGEENATLMDAVIQALRATDIDGLVVETHGYSLRPIYPRPEPNRPQRIEEYRVTNHVRVQTTDLDAVGRLLDLGIGAGANRIANLTFEASEMEEARLMAVRQAVQNARAEAEAVADAAGLTLGPALEIQVNSQIPRALNIELRTAVAFDAATTTPIEAGELRVSANVTIRYGIGR